MKNLYTTSALALFLLLIGCAKEASPFQSSEMAPLYQHWVLEFDNDVVTGVPYSTQYADAVEIASGYEFFKDGKGVDYGFAPPANFTFEIKQQGEDRIVVIEKSVPHIRVNNNYHEGQCQNNLSNGSGCNNTENFNDAPALSIVYESKTESFRIVALTKSSLQGYLMD